MPPERPGQWGKKKKKLFASGSHALQTGLLVQVVLQGRHEEGIGFFSSGCYGNETHKLLTGG